MEERIQKAEAFRKLGIDPYATKSGRTDMAGDITGDYSKYQGKKVTVAGRIMFWRDFGKLGFIKLRDESGDIQVMLRKEDLEGINDQLKLYDVGDFIDATGTVVKSKTGEVSVEAEKISILTKSVRPLPEKNKGLKDVESRYRRRYLDFLLNEEARDRILKRTGIEKAIREFLWDRDFIEVDCPILQPTYGGTNAEPFITHINALDVDVYLAIANELYLKRAVVAGFENVFTIGRLFRNEGVDRAHNPEFSMLETMSAYKNYEYNMDLTEEMYRYICENVFKRFEYTIKGEKVNFDQEWRRVMMVDLVREETGLDFDKMTKDEANEILTKAKLEPQPSVGEALVVYMEAVVGPELIQPTIVYGHPVEISPLCKRIPGSDKYVERFELYIGGIETGDNWTELNDPVELRERFEEQQRRKEMGEEDAHPMDMDFLEAMEFGMPPTTGLGPGIERIAMMLTETENIDDVLWFPIMKKKEDVEKKPEERYPYDDQKITVVVADDLDIGVAMNVVGHLDVAVGRRGGDIMGRNAYVDSEGNIHRGISRYPVIILKASKADIKKVVEEARDKSVIMVDYPSEMFTTRTDDDLNAAIENSKHEKMEYWGVALCGNSEIVTELTKDFKLYK